MGFSYALLYNVEHGAWNSFKTEGKPTSFVVKAELKEDLELVAGNPVCLIWGNGTITSSVSSSGRRILRRAFPVESAKSFPEMMT